jgi:hypothetical protein
MKRFSFVAAMVLAVSTMTAGPTRAQTLASPNIKVDDLFDALVDDLLDSSPTFLRQYRQIAGAPLVRVSVGVLPKREESCCRARTVVRRYATGAIIASVEIPMPRRRLEYAELLGHEFEHIIEQIESVDVDGRNETARAHRAGLAVSLEASTASARANRGSIVAHVHFDR